MIQKLEYIPYDKSRDAHYRHWTVPNGNKRGSDNLPPVHVHSVVQWWKIWALLQESGLNNLLDLKLCNILIFAINSK